MRVRSLVCAALLALAAAALPAARAGESRAQALANYMKTYYQDVPTKKPELVATLKELGALFEAKEIREFPWGAKFAYADLVKWNDLVNAALEKEGCHAYIVEQQAKGFVFLRCLLGRLEKKEPGREFQMLGRKFKTDVYVISDLLVGAESFLRFNPSFYSDRGRVYCVTDIWRKSYGGIILDSFEKWRKQGLDPGKEESLDKLLPEANEDNCKWQLAYRAWRATFLKAQAAGDQAGETFRKDCGDAMMRDCLPEEAVHALQNEKAFTNADELLAQVAAMALAEHPHAVLAELYAYRKQPAGSPYRQAYEQAVPAIAAQALKLAGADPAVAAMFGKDLPADAAAAKPLLYRLDEKALRQAAAAVLEARAAKP